MNCSNTKVNTLSLSVDSLFRENYNTTSSSNYTFNLPEPISNVISMKVTAIEIPNFWYMFSSNKRNNEFKIKVYNYKYQDANENMIDVPSTEYHIIFPNGNYQNIDFVNYLTAYFNNIKGGLAYIIVEIDVNTGKTIFRARHPIDDSTKPSPYDLQTPFYSSNFYFTLDFRLSDNLERPIFKNMGWVLGFIKPFYIVNFDNKYETHFIPNDLDTINQIVTFNAYCKSESSYGNSINNYIFLDLDDFNKSFTLDEIMSCLPRKYLQGNNIIARISVNSISNSINFTTGSDSIMKSRTYFGPVEISKLNIRLLDKFGELIEMNGNDFSFLIEFKFI